MFAPVGNIAYILKEKVCSFANVFGNLFLLFSKGGKIRVPLALHTR